MIDLGDEECFIGVKDNKTGDVYMMKGTKAEFGYIPIPQYTMTIYGKNRIPKEISSETIPSSGRNILHGNITLTPNPARSTCKIGYSAYNTIAGMPVIDVADLQTGRKVAQFRPDTYMGTVELNVSSLSNGYYNVNLWIDNNQSMTIRSLASEKLIVNH